MEVFHAGGFWGAWYLLLWTAVVPFVFMLGWTLLHVSATNSAEENTWLNGAVLGAFFVLIVTSFLSAILFARAQSSRTWWTYVSWLTVHFVFWTFLGSGIFFASLSALAAGPRLVMRRVAAFLAVVGVVVVHVAQLYVAYRFRTR